MFIGTFFQSYDSNFQDRSLCGDCDCPNDHIKCSTKQDRVRKFGRVTVVETGFGEKTRFYPRTGILILSKKFMKDGYHNITFRNWDFWSEVYYPNQLFVRKSESLISLWKDGEEIEEEEKDYYESMDDLMAKVTAELEEEKRMKESEEFDFSDLNLEEN